MLKAENKNVQHQRRPEIVPRHLCCNLQEEEQYHLQLLFGN